jgi:hypothetical protein
MSLPDVPSVTRALRVLQGLLGRTPQFADARIVTASTTMTDADDTLLVATAGGAVTVTLMVASTVLGRRFTVKKMDASANNVVLDGNGSETLDGAANITWNTQYTSYTVQAVMTASPATFNWVIVGKGLL